MKFLTTTFSCLLALGLTAQDAPLLHSPSLSPDGSQLAFSYQGDIWTVATDGGVARRLTIHESYEDQPQWSPDGSKIAFHGNRYGNNDIFVIDVNGGAPQRLTYNSSNDFNASWKGNDRVVFSTNRLFRQVERHAEVYEVGVNGGTPERVLDATGDFPAYSADGRYLAYGQGNCRFAREAYTGPANRNIWIYDTREDRHFPFAEKDAQETYADWGQGQQIFWLSAESGRYNIYTKGLLDRSQPRQLTNFKDEGIRNFDVSDDGSMVAFERGMGIFVMPTDGSSRRARQVDIEVSQDYRFDPVKRETFTRNANGIDVSPNGQNILIEVRGEIFVRINDKEKDNMAVQLTNHPYRDINAAWLNDSTVLFTSDRSGNYELYLLQSADADEPDLYRSLKHQTTRLTNTDVDETSFVLSPDHDRIAITQGRGKLIVADIDSMGRMSNEITLLDGWDTPGGVSWSPDGQWLAYGLSDLDFNNEIYIHAADNSQSPVNVSMHPRNDYSPVWSNDGSKLGFVSIRNNGDADLWFAWLKDSDWQKTQQDWEWEDEDESEADSVTVIDLEGIHERLVQVTRMPGNEDDLAISNDGETFYFTTNNGGRNGSPGGTSVMSIKWDGSEQNTIATNTRLRTMFLGPQGKKLYFLKSNGSIASMKDGGKKLEGLSFSASMAINHYEERKQVIDEAWRALRDGFYDPNFHGQDWDALREKYEPIALAASTKQDFLYIFNTMLGQLNASHMGIYGSGEEETQRDRTGLLGTEVEAVTNGVRITSVVPGSPADREASKLNVGDVITAINGNSLTGSANMYEYLQGTVNNRTLLAVTDAQGGTREVVIRPTSSLRTELYEAWVNERKRLTEEYSGGRLGYIHIQGMNWPSFERFERELTASGLGKDGIVIDVRFNGGGWTTDMLMTVLNVRQHAYTVPRGAASSLNQHPNFANTYPYGERLPFAALTKPRVALCNQTSYSNAEIFSHAFKHLDHGTLVGMPTFGAVISTGGMGLLDGSFVRMPFRGWYVKATGENMETSPAVPDVIVENAPDSKAEGRDEQLRKAVETLLSEMK